MLYGISDVACDLVGLSTRPDRLRREEFWAVDDVTLDLAPGDTLGIVGPNGSGKSTLLKMLNGIIYPDRGRIAVRGRVGALIEVGAGFHPMLTGRENIYVNGAILGLTRAEIRRQFDSIVDFAEIGDFLDVPVKHYSSGMYVRLGFAVAAHCRPAVLLVDEVLSVGDISFQRKCFRHFEENILNRGVTLILVSHSIYTIARMCAKGLLLNKGRVEYCGDAAGLPPKFFELMRRQNGTIDVQADGALRPGAGEIRLQSIEFRDAHDQPATSVVSGEVLTVLLRLRATRDFSHAPSVVLKLMDQANTLMALLQVPLDLRRVQGIRAGENLFACRIDRINLIPGNYTAQLKIGGGSDLLQDNVLAAATLEVRGTDDLYIACEGAGLIYLPAEWSAG
jgi:lipopolysaccharide transport system ATP-binding protein